MGSSGITPLLDRGRIGALTNDQLDRPGYHCFETSSDFESLRAAWTKTLKFRCVFCGGMHEISVRETYIEGPLHDATDRSGHV